MGQRTIFITVAENKNGEKKVNAYYSQWGIGRIMPMAAMSCIINNERRGYDVNVSDGLVFDAKIQGYVPVFSQTYGDGGTAVKKFYDPKKLGEFADNYDNNNGAVVLYAKQDKSDTYGTNTEYEIGFLLGSEDEFGVWNGEPYNENSRGLGDAFSRWLTLEEWAGIGCNKRYTDKKFLRWFRGFLDEFGVKVKE